MRKLASWKNSSSLFINTTTRDKPWIKKKMKHTLHNKNNLLRLYNFALLFYFKPNSNYVPVHTTAEELKNFMSPLRPTVHTNPSRKRGFSKTLLKLEIWKRRLRLLVWTENILKGKRSVDRKHLMRFQRETSLFNFFRRDHNFITTKDNYILFGTLSCRRRSRW